MPPLRSRTSTLVLALVCLALAGCGGDDGDGGGDGGDRDVATDARTETADTETGSGGGGGSGDALGFEQIEDFTIETLQAEASVREECSELAWLDEAEKREKLPQFQGVESFEALACEGVPYVLYYVFPDARSADTALGQSQLPYLAAGGTTAVQPLIALDERAAIRYLEALREECGCGEIVRP